MKNNQRIVTSGTIGFVLLIMSQALMAGKLSIVPIGGWGFITGFIGLLLISYAAYQIHEALWAFFWSVTAFIAVYFLMKVSENSLLGYFAVFFFGIPGIILMFHGVQLLVNGRRQDGKDT